MQNPYSPDAPIKRANRAVNLMIDPDTDSALDRMAREDHVSRSHVVRQLITRAVQMKYSGAPACADGGRCLCPQLHAPQGPRP